MGHGRGREAPSGTWRAIRKRQPTAIVTQRAHPTPQLKRRGFSFPIFRPSSSCMCLVALTGSGHHGGRGRRGLALQPACALGVHLLRVAARPRASPPALPWAPIASNQEAPEPPLEAAGRGSDALWREDTRLGQGDSPSRNITAACLLASLSCQPLGGPDPTSQGFQGGGRVKYSARDGPAALVKRYLFKRRCR